MLNPGFLSNHPKRVQRFHGAIPLKRNILLYTGLLLIIAAGIFIIANLETGDDDILTGIYILIAGMALCGINQLISFLKKARS